MQKNKKGLTIEENGSQKQRKTAKSLGKKILE